MPKTQRKKTAAKKGAKTRVGLKSVRAKAPIPSFTAAEMASSIRTAPSTMEYSEWRRK